MRHSRIAIVTFACSALLYAQGFGVHVHMAADHPHDPAHEVADVHEHGVAHVVHEHDADHSADHSDEGTIDLNLAGQVIAKTPSLNVLAVLFAAFVLFAASRVPVSVPRPRNRRLAHRRRIPHLLPPPQAPPFAS